MRFDDSLETVLSAETSSPFGAQSAWRQLVDLIARRRAAPDAETLARLRGLRGSVPPPVRAASARAAAFAEPPAELVAFHAEDDLAIAAPLLRVARLNAGEWIALLPGLSPGGRAVLRHRRDLAPVVNRALESFGSVDFVLGSDHPAPAETPAPVLAPAALAPAAPAAIEAPPDSAFVSLSSIALGLPVVAEAMRVAGQGEVPREKLPPPSPPRDAERRTFEIADLVARIDAYQRRRVDPAHPPAQTESQPALFDLATVPARSFRFETDAAGIVRWIEGAARGPLIGLSLDPAAPPGATRVDGVVSGAFRRRASFADARLVVSGGSDAAGQWRITASPAFDHASGKFTGYRGAARRPRADERAEPAPAPRGPGADALRQLVHELRTPTNAIAGFAEMIESQMMGPVPPAYRAQAGAIRDEAAGLLTAIDDIDLAARIDSHALDLRPGDVPLAPLLRRIADDLAPLAAIRGTSLLVECGNGLVIAGDDRAVERLLARLLATLVASGGRGERIALDAARDTSDIVIMVDRPAALAAFGGEAILSIDAEAGAEAPGAPLLGTGFALRLARNLAGELGGALAFGERRLTLRLPAAFISTVEQASSN